MVAAFCYGVVVPGCLLYLYAKQHLLLLPGKATVAWAADHADLEVWLVQTTSSSPVTCWHRDGETPWRMNKCSTTICCVGGGGE